MAFSRWSSERAYQRPQSRLPLSSTLLFLSIILPQSSFAQITGQSPPSVSTLSTLITTSPPSSASLSTVANSTTNTDTPSTPPRISDGPDSPEEPPSVPPSYPGISNEGTHVFNYYFLIVILAGLLLGVCLFYLGRRKRRKAALLQSHSHRALAQDVAGFRTRLGRAWNYNGFGFGLGGSDNGNRQGETIEGLDERGMAPPPYVPASKPPSLRSEEGIRGSTSRTSSETLEREGLELGRLDTASDRSRMSDPPGYDGHVGSHVDSSAQITRPDTAVLASDVVGSPRRLPSSDGHSSSGI